MPDMIMDAGDGTQRVIESDAIRALVGYVEQLRANLDERAQAGDAARQAAARIDAAFSHGVPSGSEDPVTADDWRRVLRYARSAGIE